MSSFLKTIRNVFNKSSWPNVYETALRENGLVNCRAVGGLYQIDHDFKQKLKASNIHIQSNQGAVFLSEKSHDEAAAFFVGVKTDGTTEIVALKNYGRPDDRGYTDRLSARRHAHAFRSILSASCKIHAKESSKTFNPSR